MPASDGSNSSPSPQSSGPVSTGNAVPVTGEVILRATENLNVVRASLLSSPRQIKNELPMTPAANAVVVESRQTIQRIIAGQDLRMLVVLGPCSIHDEQAALEYAQRLRSLSDQLADRLFLVMRVYFEKPRTTLGWKGLVNDPHLDGSFDIETGLRVARKSLRQIVSLGIPAGTEMLDPITPQYLADMVSWAAIGARTIESQTHREMASGLSMPVGYKNGTSGDLQIALDAMIAARSTHAFLGIDEEGRTSIIQTRGNPWGHIILRGGKSGPNYDSQTLAAATTALIKAQLPSTIMVDCSHANANKQYQNQEIVWRNAVQQRLAGNHSLMGLLLESHLEEGNQPFPQPVQNLRYGLSITDQCIGWTKTQELLLWAHQQLSL